MALFFTPNILTLNILLVLNYLFNKFLYRQSMLLTDIKENSSCVEKSNIRLLNK